MSDVSKNKKQFINLWDGNFILEQLVDKFS